MTYSDFCRCTYAEFEAICAAWHRMRDDDSHSQWERLRTLAAITIQPHVKRKLTPRQLIPLPWDNEPSKPHRASAPTLTPEQRQSRFAVLANRHRQDPTL